MWYRRCTPLLCALLLLIAWPVAAQEAPSIRLDAQPFFGGTFRSGVWLPFHITVANDGRDVEAVVRVQTGAIYETALDLPHGAHKSITIYARPTSTFRPTATVRVLVNDVEAAKVEIPLVAVSTSTRLIGVLSPGTFSVPLPAKGGLRYEAVTLQPSDLPERSEGLMLFDALVIDGAPLESIQPSQQQALADWVMAGGQVLVGGDQIAATLQKLPESLKIATTTNITRETAPTILTEQSKTIPMTLLRPLEGARVLDQVDGNVVAVQHTIGKGTASIVGFSLTAPQLANLPSGAPLFWSKVVQLPVFQPNMPPEFSNSDFRTEQLGYALMQLPTLAMPPLGTLGGLLLTYLLIVGPGMYLVLRRFDRQAWGWIAIPAATLLFSIGVYGYALQLRGNDIIVNQISIVEPLGERMLVQTLGGIFSPHTQTYTVNSTSDVLFRPISTAFMGGAPAAANRNSTSYRQTPASIRELAVAQWSMSSFIADQIIDGSPLAARFSVSDEMLHGEVHNTGTTAITGLALVQYTRVEHIGDLQPGERRSVEMKLGGGAPSVWDSSLAWRILSRQGNAKPRPDVPTPEVAMQESVLNAVLSSPFGASVPQKPTLLGWMEQPPASISIDPGRAQYQQLSLITMTIEPTYPANAHVTLPRGWLAPSIEASSRNGGPCMTSSGLGWYTDTGVMTTTLQLPAKLQRLQLDNVTLFGQIDGPNGDDIKVSAYDWAEREWVPLEDMNFAGGSKELEEPARFLGPDGSFQFSTDLSDMRRQEFGCMSLDLRIEGTLP